MLIKIIRQTTKINSNNSGKATFSSLTENLLCNCARKAFLSWMKHLLRMNWKHEHVNQVNRARKEMGILHLSLQHLFQRLSMKAKSTLSSMAPRLPLEWLAFDFRFNVSQSTQQSLSGSIIEDILGCFLYRLHFWCSTQIMSNHQSSWAQCVLVFVT